jgi:hypothetical protein
VDFLLFVFNGFVQLCDPKLQPLYFSVNIVPMEHLPVFVLAEDHKLYATREDGGKHDLKLHLVSFKEFDPAEDRAHNKRQRIHTVNKQARQHLFTVQLTRH